MTRRYGVDRNGPTVEEMVQRAQGYHPNESFMPLPPPTGAAPYRLPLSALGSDPIQTLSFHVIGDSGGVKDPAPQHAVAVALEADLTAQESAVQFLYHLGDVVYFNGAHSEYFPQFYEPLEHYNRPVVAIPGNHDGDNSDDPTVASLSGFVENFCAAAPHFSPDAKDAPRDTMTQPNVFWTLSAALVTIIGCYTNVPSGGQVASDQADWLASELAAAPEDRPVIVAMHHPPYSGDAHHGGSARMGSLLDAATKQAGRKPHLVLSGHVHNYQRFTRDDGTAYVVVGNSGYHNLHAMAAGATAGQKIAGSDVTLEAFLADRYGFLRVTVTGGSIIGQFVACNPDGTTVVFDSFTITPA